VVSSETLNRLTGIWRRGNRSMSGRRRTGGRPSNPCMRCGITQTGALASTDRRIRTKAGQGSCLPTLRKCTKDGRHNVLGQNQASAAPSCVTCPRSKFPGSHYRNPSLPPSSVKRLRSRSGRWWMSR